MSNGDTEGAIRQNGGMRTLPTEDLRIEQFFHEHSADLAVVRKAAREARERMRAVDSFIQRHTSEVCPLCRKSCCIHRHASYNLDDLIYIYALGLKPPRYDGRADTEPCQFLAEKGCRLAREVRPSGCTWYFCDSLLSHMEKTPGAAYEEFDDNLRELAEVWLEMISGFRAVYRKKTGYEVD